MSNSGKGRIKNLVLIHSPIDKVNYQDARQHYAPSQAIVALKTFVQRSCPDVEVKLIDGSFMDTDSIIVQIMDDCPHIVGQSVQQLSYDNALRIASAAKATGAINVFGGQHATQIAREIITNRHEIVDAVISYDGEIPLAMICHGVPFTEIPNLTHWKGGLRENQSIHWGLDTYPPPDYTDIDLEPYVESYTRRLCLDSPQTFLRTYSHKGCGNRLGSTACYFCGRADKGVRFKTPERYVTELAELQDYWGAESVFDTGDDIAFRKTWLREAAQRVKERKLNLEMGCFGRAIRLRDPEVPDLLRKIGIRSVIIGFESGDPEILKRCGKGRVSPDDNFTAATNLFKKRIDVCASYVIGLPGESQQSLKRTYDNAQRLLELANRHLGRPPYELVANLFEPSPGSPAFQRIKEFYPEKYDGRDILDLQEVQEDYFRSHWNLSPSAVREFREMLVEWAMAINSLTVESDYQGFRTDEAVTRDIVPVPEVAHEVARN